MTSGLGSISITASSLLGGTASKIDTDALVTALMQAKSIPQQQLQAQVKTQGQIITALQSVNSATAGISTAAQTALDSDSWSATKVSSSSTGVSASSTPAAGVGSTTFTVDALAQAQVSTIQSAGPAGWIADYTQGLDITTGTGASAATHHIDLASGSVADIASAINSANVGVRASVVNTDSGQVLQLSSAQTGIANQFSVTGLTPTVNTITAAQDAQISVGKGQAGGYTVSSSSNTFTDAIPGVTFTIGAAALNQSVTLGVTSDTDKVAGTVQAMVDAVNSTKLAIGNYTAKGGVLQGDPDMNSLTQSLSSVFSSATADGRSLTDFGIDINKDGIVAFDSSVFTAAYAADPKGTMQAISDAVATPLKTIADDASAPITGTVSQAITSANDKTSSLNDQIASWTDRLNAMQTQLTLKYTAMQTALAKLQSQGDWLTSMFKSMQSNSGNSNQ